MSKVIIIRHAERLDEVDMGAWREVLKHHRRKHMQHRSRCTHSEGNDPHLTYEGLKQAQEAAEHLVQVLRDQNVIVECIYSSRLIRTVQTANCIAKLLNVPIVVSSALAESAAAVAKKGGSVHLGGTFDLLSIAELAHFAPGIELVEGDAFFHSAVVQQGQEDGAASDDEVIGGWLDNSANCDGMSTPPREEKLDNRSRARANWEKCVYNIAQRQKTSVVVAHRETIRDLAPELEGRRVPYCALAYFEFSGDDVQQQQQQQQALAAASSSCPSIMLRKVSHRDGTIMFAKETSNTSSAAANTNTSAS